MFKVLVCGSRDYDREMMVNAWLDGLYATYGEELYIIAGGAKGADQLAEDWVKEKWPKRSFDHYWRVDAEWSKLGAYAGPARNKVMLEEGKPDLVLAFKDDFNWKMDKGGTENMVKISQAAGVPTFVIQKA